MIDKLKVINEHFINAYKNDQDNLKKHILIKEILNQKNCFSNMDIEYAYSILRDLHIPESELKKVYLGLI